MTAAPGDSLEFGEGSAAHRGERNFPGALAAFKAAYAKEPHGGLEMGEGVFCRPLDSTKAVVFYARERNKVAILAIKKAGVKLDKDELIYLGQLVAILRKRGLK